MGGDPPEEDQGLHWHDREPCPFTREEGEAYGTYVASDMSRNEGDDMLKWVCNRAYRPRRLRFRNIRSLSLAVRRQYVPEGVQGINFHEPLDGHQNVMFYRRDLLPLIRRLLSRPNFANTGVRPETLVKRMKNRLHGLCDSPFVQHITLLTLGNQKILEGWDVLNKELKSKKKERSQPIVNANDVGKLLLALIFVLDRLGQPELEAHNRQQARRRDRATG